VYDGDSPLAETTSLCPTCLERVPGEYHEVDGSVHLARECPDHGVTSRRVWDDVDHWEWARELSGPRSPDPRPDGELTVENDHACLAVVEVTTDCNLSCPFCFASSGPGGDHRPREEVERLLEVVRADGGPRPVQFSGGEPTVRDDLPELVELARGMGFEHVQVNTNGLRLAREDDYATELEAAGVSAVYLQFDGVTDEVYERTRGAPLAADKRAAVEACRRAGLSVVLVPTVVPGVNDDEMGDVVRFAFEHSVVQSVNFQPVAHFGRTADDNGRFSLDTAASRLADQLEGVETRDLLPVPCCSATCQSATVLRRDDEGVTALTGFLDDELFGTLSGLVEEADWMELLANTETGRERACSTAGCCGDISLPVDPGGLLDGSLPVSFTGFMDADAADTGKLSNCCVSVPTEADGLVPFCAYNMTTEDGRYALRNRNGWGGRAGVTEPEPDDGSTPAEAGTAEGDD
jgi:uncharacterized radical SAM superfamily Fe-S cluster-containing enzyme